MALPKTVLGWIMFVVGLLMMIGGGLGGGALGPSVAPYVAAVMGALAGINTFLTAYLERQECPKK